MLTRLEKEGFTQILSKLSRGEVDALKDTVTKKQIVTHGKDGESNNNTSNTDSRLLSLSCVVRILWILVHILL